MQSPVSMLARIALLPLLMMVTANVQAEPLWQYQWALENNDASQGVCTTVPWTGDCERDRRLAVADIDINGAPVSGETDSSITTEPVVIGMIDTGIDYRHPDIRRHVWTNPGERKGTDHNGNGTDDGCEDGVDGDANGYLDDCHGINTLVPARLPDGGLNPAAGDPLDSALAHGTHMAGLMVGDGGANGMGIRGVAGDAPVQVVTCKSAQLEPVLALIPGTVVPALTQQSMKQCVDYFIALKQRGVNIGVINASGGMSAYLNLGLMWAKVKPEYQLDSQVFATRLAQLQALDILVVGAAGNMGWDIDTRAQERAYFPGAFAASHVMSVAAIDAQGMLWSGSSWGRYTVDVAAPGHLVLSTLPTTPNGTGATHYGIASGTSPATALVSGLAARLRAHAETAHLNAAALRRLIMASGQVLPALQDKVLSARSIRVTDTEGRGALTCLNQRIQRRLLPRTDQTTLLPGMVLQVEIESFNCADIPAGPLTLTSPQGATLTLWDDGTSGDRVAGDGIFSTQWEIPAAPAFRYDFALDQGSGLGTETLTVFTSIIADNGDPASDASGLWWPTQLRSGFWGAGYSVAYVSSSERQFRWKPTLPRAGRYDVMVRWPESTAFASNALFRFTEAGGRVIQLRLNQRVSGGQWVSVGDYRLEAGSTIFTLSNAGADSTVAADAIRLVWKSE